MAKQLQGCPWSCCPRRGWEQHNSMGFSCTPCTECFPWAELFLGQDSLDLCSSGELLRVPDQAEHKSCSGNVISGGRRSSSCAVQRQKSQILQSIAFQLRAKAGNYKHTWRDKCWTTFCPSSEELGLILVLLAHGF